MFIHGSRSICILSGFIWETSAKWLKPRQLENFTKAARCLEAFVAKNYTLLVFSHLKEVLECLGFFFFNYFFIIFTFTQPHLCEVLKLLSKLTITTVLFSSTKIENSEEWITVSVRLQVFGPMCLILHTLNFSWHKIHEKKRYSLSSSG